MDDQEARALDPADEASDPAPSDNNAVKRTE